MGRNADVVVINNQMEISVEFIVLLHSFLFFSCRQMWTELGGDEAKACILACLRDWPKCFIIWLHFETQRTPRDQEGSCWDRRSEQTEEMETLLVVLLSMQLYHRLWQASWQWDSSFLFLLSQFHCFWCQFVKWVLTQHVHRQKLLSCHWFLTTAVTYC